jgi:hypothetical protein
LKGAAVKEVQLTAEGTWISPKAAPKPDLDSIERLRKE